MLFPHARHQVLMAVAMKMRQQVPPEGGTFLADYTAWHSRRQHFSVTVVRTSHSNRNTWRQKCRTCNCKSTRYIGRTFLFRTPQRKSSLLFDPDFGFWNLRKWALPTFLIFRLQVSPFFLIDQHTARWTFKRGNLRTSCRMPNFNAP